MDKHKTLTTLKGTINPSLVRIEAFQGEDRIVVPVVAMVGDLVTRPMGSDPEKAGEIIPTQELSELPEKWNDTLVVPDHPVDAVGNAIAASSPTTVSSMGFGRVYNSRFSNGSLQFEIWLSQGRAALVGMGAVEAVNNAQAGQLVENSIGFYSFKEEVEGVSPNGTPYSFVHHDIVPDHFAFGLPGTTGACSVADGCGGPRVASKDLQPRRRMLQAAARDKDEPIATKLLRRAYHALADLGISDRDLRRNITDQLSATVPGFDWIRAVFQETGSVVYDVFLLEQFSLWQQSYTKAEDGTITLLDDAVEVKEETTTEFVPVATTTEPVPTAARSESNNSTESPANLEPERTTMNDEEKKSLVARIIACGANDLTAEDEKTLLASQDSILLAIPSALEQLEEPAVTSTSPCTAASQPCEGQDTPGGADAAVGAFRAPEGYTLLSTGDHERLMASLKDSEEQKAVYRQTLVAAAIQANPALTEDELASLPLATLAKMSPQQAQAGPVNYGLQPQPMAVAADEVKIPKAEKLSVQMKAKPAATVN